MAHNKDITKKAKLLRKEIKGLKFVDSINIIKILNGRKGFDYDIINSKVNPLGWKYESFPTINPITGKEDYSDLYWDFVPLNRKCQ